MLFYKAPNLKGGTLTSPNLHIAILGISIITKYEIILAMLQLVENTPNCSENFKNNTDKTDDDTISKTYSFLEFTEKKLRISSKLVAPNEICSVFQCVGILDFKDKYNCYFCIPEIEEISNFLYKLYDVTQFSVECFIISMVYIGRAIANRKGLYVTTTTWRPILFTALMIAQKYWDDEYLSNQDFVLGYSGHTLLEANTLEKNFLFILDYHVGIQPAEYAYSYFNSRSVVFLDFEMFYEKPTHHKFLFKSKEIYVKNSQFQTLVKRTADFVNTLLITICNFSISTIKNDLNQIEAYTNAQVKNYDKDQLQNRKVQQYTTNNLNIFKYWAHPALNFASKFLHRNFFSKLSDSNYNSSELNETQMHSLSNKNNVSVFCFKELINKANNNLKKKYKVFRSLIIAIILPCTIAGFEHGHSMFNYGKVLQQHLNNSSIKNFKNYTKESPKNNYSFESLNLTRDWFETNTSYSTQASSGSNWSKHKYSNNFSYENILP